MNILGRIDSLKVNLQEAQDRVKGCEREIATHEAAIEKNVAAFVEHYGREEITGVQFAQLLVAWINNN